MKSEASARLRDADLALLANPADPVALRARAKALMDWGRFREARDTLLQIGSHSGAGVVCELDAAVACFASGRNAEAVTILRAIVARTPSAWRPLFELGRVLQSEKAFGEAEACYITALNLGADDIHCLMNSGICRLVQGDSVRAEAIFRQCLAREPHNAKCWLNLGVALWTQGRDPEALGAIVRANAALEDADDRIETLAQSALYLTEMGRAPEARDALERELPRNPDPMGHLLLGIIILRGGDLAEGWHQFAFRWLVAPLASTRARLRVPEWRGQDASGRVILIRLEGGYGDTFHFIRYAPLVKSLGATVILQSWDALRGIDHRFAGVDAVVREREPMPRFDYWISLLSLAWVFGTDLQTIPGRIPYLSADRVREDSWRARLKVPDGLRVGLVWTGNPRHSNERRRSMSFAQWLPLLDIDGVQFFALQKGARETEADSMAAGKALTNLASELHDFGDTAAVIAQLDLVISVDTSVVHLTGALGKPVWVLLSEPADWRWLTEREDSPWYPTARLFRQKRRGDWDEVIVRVKEALREWVAAGGKAPELPQRSEPMPKPRMGRAPRRIAGLSAVTEARVGIVQYFPDDEPMGPSLEWYGEWLQGQLELMLKWVRAGGVGMEVGAGVGAHAIALGEALGPEGHLFLYEGRAVVKQVLSQNLGANRIGNVTLMRRMLGGPEGGAGVETLDELQLARLDWLKVNAPVPAQTILSGGAATLWRLRPLLLLAVEDEAGLAALAEQVKGLGYRCWRVETPLHDPANFNRRDDDIFAGRSALALAAAPEETDPGALWSQRTEM